jgi:hypothetical protein
LSNNQLSGNIPIFNSEPVPKLAHLDLSANRLKGTISKIFNEFFYFKWLDLSSNLLEGTIPIIPTSPCAYINLSNNGFSGGIDWSGMLPFAKLNLSYNQLDGLFGIPFIDGITEFDIAHNKFTGFLAVQLNVTTIRYCDASDNKFDCPLPRWLEERCKASCT